MTFEELKNVIVETLSADADAITMEARLTEDLNADSLDAVELNMALEEKCGVSIPDDKLGEMKTVGDIYNYLTENA
ncbi:acyl carrier protein [uncultured Subdoligranulum sp.]|uniref:acyl carrier protein n=1 Tax=uncultured Subdoligranulum sp. TaxID=512298 RepID=UPI0025D7D1F6|nr:acyl carrier protein [uncultured Subdoligranulum sp.]